MLQFLDVGTDPDGNKLWNVCNDYYRIGTIVLDGEGHCRFGPSIEATSLSIREMAEIYFFLLFLKNVA